MSADTIISIQFVYCVIYNQYKRLNRCDEDKKREKEVSSGGNKKKDEKQKSLNLTGMVPFRFIQYWGSNFQLRRIKEQSGLGAFSR